jgi:hypothetical protein
LVGLLIVEKLIEVSRAGCPFFRLWSVRLEFEPLQLFFSLFFDHLSLFGFLFLDILLFQVEPIWNLLGFTRRFRTRRSSFDTLLNDIILCHRGSWLSGWDHPGTARRSLSEL